MGTHIYHSDRSEPCAACRKPGARTVYAHTTTKTKPLTFDRLVKMPVFCNITCFKERNKRR